MQNTNPIYKDQYKPQDLPHAKLAIKAGEVDVDTATTSRSHMQGRTQTASPKALRNGFSLWTVSPTRLLLKVGTSARGLVKPTTIYKPQYMCKNICYQLGKV